MKHSHTILQGLGIRPSYFILHKYYQSQHLPCKMYHYFNSKFSKTFKSMGECKPYIFTNHLCTCIQYTLHHIMKVFHNMKQATSNIYKHPYQTHQYHCLLCTSLPGVEIFVVCVHQYYTAFDNMNATVTDTLGTCSMSKYLMFNIPKRWVTST